MTAPRRTLDKIVTAAIVRAKCPLWDEHETRQVALLFRAACEEYAAGEVAEAVALLEGVQGVAASAWRERANAFLAKHGGGK